MLDYVVKELLIPAFIAGVGAMVMFLLKNAMGYFSSKLKESLHFRGSSVVVDSLFSTASVMGYEVKDILADGKITPEEKLRFNRAWKKECSEKLVRLSGFAKAELDAWITEQMNITLGKLLAQTL